MNFNVIVRTMHIHILFIDPVFCYRTNSHNSAAINANKYRQEEYYLLNHDYMYVCVNISKTGSPSALSMKFPQNRGVIGFAQM